MYWNIASACKDRNTILKLLNPSRISTHADADGLASCALIKSMVSKKIVVNIPSVFGHIDARSTLVLDQVPKTDTHALVIDHHPLKAHTGKDNYPLIHDTVPTSLIVYQVFKEQIPMTETWKVAVGLVGDQQPYMIPPEIWETYTELLDELVSIGKSRGASKYWQASNPLWLSLSNINYLCRLGGSAPYQALNLLIDAKHPYDLIYNEAILNARDLILKEIERLTKESKRMIDLGALRVWFIQSEYVVEGLLSSSLQSLDKKTLIVFNENKHKFSIRGVLTGYLIEKLKHKYEIGGHPLAGAGVLTEGQTVNRFMSDLRLILKALR